MTNLDPHNIVFVGIEIRLPAEDRAGDFLFVVDSEQKVGAITITTLENPHPVHVLDDLVTHATASRMSVAHVDGGRAQDCVWMHGPVKTGNLGFGPAIPGDRAECAGGGFVGVTVFAVLDYTARRCIYAPPPGGSGVSGPPTSGGRARGRSPGRPGRRAPG